jgi:hypothetical protein
VPCACGLCFHFNHRISAARSRFDPRFLSEGRSPVTLNRGSSTIVILTALFFPVIFEPRTFCECHNHDHHNCQSVDESQRREYPPLQAELFRHRNSSSLSLADAVLPSATVSESFGFADTIALRAKRCAC